MVEGNTSATSHAAKQGNRQNPNDKEEIGDTDQISQQKKAM